MSYFITVITGIINMFTFMASQFELHMYLGLLQPGNSGSAMAHHSGRFCPWIVFYNIGLNPLPSDSFVSNRIESRIEWNRIE